MNAKIFRYLKDNMPYLIDLNMYKHEKLISMLEDDDINTLNVLLEGKEINFYKAIIQNALIGDKNKEPDINRIIVLLEKLIYANYDISRYAKDFIVTCYASMELNPNMVEYFKAVITFFKNYIDEDSLCLLDASNWE